MLDDIAAMGDHSGDQDFTGRQFCSFPDMILMLVARVGGFESVGAGVYFQDQIDDFFQRRVVDARSFVDAIAGVKANLLGWDAAQGVIDRLNGALGDLAPLGERSTMGLGCELP